MHEKQNYDLITNIFPRTFPSGLSVEIIKPTIRKKFEIIFKIRCMNTDKIFL